MNTNYLKHFGLSVALLTLACVPTATALYNPTAGHWLSRDPIEEGGGRNLYTFVGSAPINRVDYFGLTPAPIPPGPTWSTQRVPVGYNCCCCDSEMIAQGHAELMSRYRDAAQYLDGAQDAGLLTLDPAPDHLGEASCWDSNSAVLKFMTPAPPCWICWLERRWPNWPTGYNENTIVCMSITRWGQSGCIESRRIVFDYFDVSFHARRPWITPPHIIQPGESYGQYLAYYTQPDTSSGFSADSFEAYSDCNTTHARTPGNHEYLILWR